MVLWGECAEEVSSSENSYFEIKCMLLPFPLVCKIGEIYLLLIKQLAVDVTLVVLSDTSAWYLVLCHYRGL
jgi:hypothetical protein